MSWDNLNNLELAALRRAMMMDVADAAKHIGNVGVRTWQHWETGRNRVPADVNEEMYAIWSQRQECLNGVTETTKPEDEPSIPFFRKYEDFSAVFSEGNEVWWRVYQSVAAFLFSEFDYTLDDEAELDKSSYLYKFFARTRPQDIEFAEQEAKLEEALKLKNI